MIEKNLIYKGSITTIISESKDYMKEVFKGLSLKEREKIE